MTETLDYKYYENLKKNYLVALPVNVRTWSSIGNLSFPVYFYCYH